METEFQISLSRSSFSPGRYTFTAVDKGRLPHSLVITKGGIPIGHTSALLSPGKSGSFAVTLTPGTYDVFCGVPGHQKAGMNTVIHVS